MPTRGFASIGLPFRGPFRGVILPEDLNSLPSRYCSVVTGLQLPVDGALKGVDECNRYLTDAVLRISRDDPLEQQSATGMIGDVNDSIERALGTLFVVNHLGSWRARAELCSTWFWTVALAMFWTAAIQFGGDLARKGIFAGLIPFWLAQLGVVSSSSLSLRLEFVPACVLSAILIVIYTCSCGSRRYFRAFRWIQLIIGIASGLITLIYVEYLQPPTLIQTDENGWYFIVNLAALCFALSMLLVVQLFGLRSASLAVSPLGSRAN